MNILTISNLLALSLSLVVSSLPAQSSVTIQPVKDCGLFQENPGQLSNGAGVVMITGQTSQGNNLRAMLQFDLTMIPSDATILEVILELPIAKADNGDGEVALHRVLQEWGEGSSMSTSGKGDTASDGDATWLHAIRPDVLWETEGGDFVANPSASKPILNYNATTWDSIGLKSDVAFWVENPDLNFGWLLIGDESQNKTTVHFSTRESETPPTLTVTYESISTSLTDVPLSDLKILPTDVGIILESKAFTNAPIIIELFDLQGKLLQTTQAIPIDHQVNLFYHLQQRTSSVYVIRVRQASKIVVAKFFR